ncbi:MAG: hypothetical protein HN849_31910 [Victivallales bacterium]|jgi:lambda repressor-like predicted transcriptional regulator|nr:hypothetical protein [Victivallales bacterium]
MEMANGQIRRRALIQDRLHLAGKSQAEVARKADVSRGMVCHVVAGRKRHRKVQQVLARVCNMKFKELWED